MLLLDKLNQDKCTKIKRNQTIDFLRGIAVLLTLFRHFTFIGIFDTMRQIGWIGVDLFFVLSGFLVSGLIFDEYKKTDDFDGKLFLIRRGFKIYPSFWVLIIFTIFYQFLFKETINWTLIGHQLIFIQNYFADVDHTWSLAVEEHFYFFIVFAFLLVIKYAKNKEKTIVTGAVIIILYGVIAKLLLAVCNHNFAKHTHFFPTHLRIDSLMLGLLIAYITRTRPDIIQMIYQRKHFVLILVVIGLLPPFIWDINKYPEQLYLAGVGLSSIVFSFGLLLILLLNTPKLEDTLHRFCIFRIITKIGFYSYSIYLWHILVYNGILELSKLQENRTNGYLLFASYFTITILTGILMGKTIEIPFLKYREKYFPKKT